MRPWTGTVSPARGIDGPFGGDRWLHGADPERGKDECLYRVNNLAAADMPSSFQVLLAYPPLLAAVSQLMNGDELAASVHALVFPGSHLAGYHDPARHPDFIERWTGGRDESTAEGAVPVPATRGDVIFHATTVIHGSPWNRSDDLRRTVYFHFDHRLDVELAGDRWPQRQFAEARSVPVRAVETRARLHPEEKPFAIDPSAPT